MQKIYIVFAGNFFMAAYDSVEKAEAAVARWKQMTVDFSNIVQERIDEFKAKWRVDRPITETDIVNSKRRERKFKENYPKGPEDGDLPIDPFSSDTYYRIVEKTVY